mgnify:CR=1 FL=1
MAARTAHPPLLSLSKYLTNKTTINTPTTKIYVALGITYCILSIFTPLFMRQVPVSGQLLIFIILASLISITIPFWQPSAIATFSVCMLCFLSLPGAYASDIAGSLSLFYLYLGRFFMLKQAFLVFLINDIASAAIILTSNNLPTAISPVITPSARTSLFEIAGITLSGFTILIGAVARQAECFWYKQASMKEERLKRIRSDIAKDMHDLVSYSMSQTVLRARMSSEDPAYSPETKAEFAAIARTGADTLHELRILLYALQKDSHYLSSSNDSPSIHAVDNIIVSANLVTHDVTDAGFHMSCHIADHIHLTRAQTLILSRILREIGANIIRHGDPATPATLTISQNQDCIRILSTNAVSENLNGALPSSGMGILSMRERLEAFGGTLTTSIEDGAWIISAIVPQTTSKERAE